MFLFVTSDKIGSETGGGQVTANELAALSSMGPVDIINPPSTVNPFECENVIQIEDFRKYKLAHFYANTYPNLVRKLKENGVKVSYTVAAHDVQLSREEFNGLGMDFSFPHLTDHNLFESYISSYKNADVVICPSTIAEATNQKYGIRNTVIVPHGCHPLNQKKFPKTFTVGYLGQCGPDKGVRYLLEAWAALDYKDAVLNLAGAQTPMLLPLIRYFGKGHVNVHGYVKSIEDFYNSCSVYVQPSVTEGFGIEVLEAMSCGRPVIVSDGAGASDCIKLRNQVPIHDHTITQGHCGFIFEKRNVRQLAEMIHLLKNNAELHSNMGIAAKIEAQNYNWKTVKSQYCTVWRNLLGEQS